MFTSNVVLFNLLQDPSISDNVVQSKKEGLLIGEQMTRGVSSDPSLDACTDTFVSNEALAEDPANSPNPQRNINFQFTQGSDVGNCVGVSNLQSFAQYEDGLEYINSIVRKDENNNYVVSFPNKEPITIDRSIIERYDAVRGNDYIEAITFALYKDAGNLDDNGNLKRADTSDIGKIALSPAGTFKRLTGIEPNFSSGEYNDLVQIDDAIKSGKKLIMQTGFKDGVQSVTNGRVFPKHAFTLLSVDTKNNVVQLANPWYDSSDEIISMSIEDFQKYTNGINFVEMKTDDGKISFSNPDIAVNPDTSEITDYKPTDKEYSTYWNINCDDAWFNEHFWESLDKNGYDAFVNNGRKLSPEVQEEMPIYSALKKEGFSPSALVKQYIETQTIPEFKDEMLQEKSDDIKNWIIENYQEITYSIQVGHYHEQQALKDARINAEIEARRETAEIENQRAIENHNNTVMSQLETGTFASVPDRAGTGVFPNDFENMKKDFYNPKITTDTKGNKYIRLFDGIDTTVYKFNPQGQIISQSVTRNGKSVTSTEYTYQDNGVRMAETKGKYGTFTQQEVYDENGNLIARNSYDHNKNKSTQITYIISPAGEVLQKSLINRTLSDSSERYSINTVKTEFEYEFNEDGSVKQRTGNCSESEE